MKSSLEKIAAGLENRERQRANPFASNIVVSAASLASLREEFHAHHTAHTKHVTAAKDRIAKFDAQQAKALADYEYRSVIDNRGEVSKQRRPAGDLAGFREQQKRDRINFCNAVATDARAACQPNRARMAEIATAIRASSNLFSPLALATSHELGSERRSRLYAEVKDLQRSPQALLHAGQRAAAEGDATLASVCIAVCDAMPADKRPFVPADLAAIVFKDRAASAREHVEHVIGSHAATLVAEQALFSAPDQSVCKIERGVANRIENADKLAADRRASLTEPQK